jgi:hypothetical protein
MNPPSGEYAGGPGDPPPPRQGPGNTGGPKRDPSQEAASVLAPQVGHLRSTGGTIDENNVRRGGVASDMSGQSQPFDSQKVTDSFGVRSEMPIDDAGSAILSAQNDANVASNAALSRTGLNVTRGSDAEEAQYASDMKDAIARKEPPKPIVRHSGGIH